MLRLPPLDDVRDRRVWSLSATVLGFWLLWAGYQTWTAGPSWVVASWQWLVLALTVLGLALLVLGALGVRWLRVAIPAAAVVGLALYAVYQHAAVQVQPGTDELAFTRFAARLVLHGLNPYAVPVAPALHRYLVLPTETTPTVTGTVVTTMSYPDLSFLLYVPARLFGVTDPVWTLIAFLALSVAVAYVVCPEPWRAFVPLLFLLEPNLLNLTLNGVTDVLYVPFLLAAVGLLRTRPRWSFLLLGLACAVKQTPWLFVPFLLVARAYDAEAEGMAWWRAAVEAIGAWALGFFIPNLPFIVLGPLPWLYGVLGPIVGHLVIYGEGAASTAFWGSVVHGPFALMSAGVVLATLAATVALYPTAPALALALPLTVFFVTARSLANYWAFAEGPLAIAVLAWRPQAKWPAWRPVLRRVSGVLLGGAVVAGVALAGLGAVTLAITHAQVTVRILSAEDPTHTDLFSRLRLRVRNLGPYAQPVSFVVTSGADSQAPWRVLGRADVVPAHATRTVTVAAPSLLAAVPNTPGAAIVVDALLPSGEQVASRPFPIREATAGIVNAQFKYWLPTTATKPGKSLPVGWVGQVAPAGLVGVTKDAYGVRLVASSASSGGWWSTSIEQSVPLAFLRRHTVRLTCQVRSLSNEPPLWRNVAGVEISGANGNQVLVVASPYKFTYRTQALTVIGEPAVRSPWQTLTIALAKSGAQLEPDLRGDVTLSVVVASKQRAGEAMIARGLSVGP